MTANTALRDVPPPVEKAGIDLEAGAEVPNIQVGVNPVSTGSATHGRKIGDILSDRTTYYWVAIIAQLGAMITSSIEFYNSDYTDGRVYAVSLTYSIIPCITIVSLLSNKSSEVGPKRTLAGKHYMSAIVCVFINIAMLFYIVADVFLSILLTSSRGFSLSIETRIIVGFHVVAAISCTKAAHITRLSAQSVRGAELVNDSEYRVPAWHLATTDESRIYHRSDRRV